MHRSSDCAGIVKTQLLISLPEGKASPPPISQSLLDASPALVETTGWPAGTTFARTPDSAWRFRLSFDGRADSDRPESIHHLPLQNDFDPAGDITTGYEEIMVRHQLALKNGNPRLVFFDSNVGVVNLERTDSLKLTQASINEFKVSLGFDGLKIKMT